MDYFTAFEISGTGLSVEKLRADLVALNIANANSTTRQASEVYRPLRLQTGPSIMQSAPLGFDDIYKQNETLGVEVVSIEKDTAEPKSIYEPANPLANAEGYIFRPNINTASEMIEMMSALRAYQANIKAISAAKVMAEEALRIGGGR